MFSEGGMEGGKKGSLQISESSESLIFTSSDCLIRFQLVYGEKMKIGKQELLLPQFN